MSKRKSVPVATLGHGLSVNCASFSPDGAHLISVCQDNLLRCFDGAGVRAGAGGKKGGVDPGRHAPRKQFRHDCRTGRWLTKFRARWDPKMPGAFFIGSMAQPRCVEAYSCDPRGGRRKIMRMRDDYVGSVQSLTVPHPSMHALATANSSGRVYVWR
jgi:WD40 repeat protein